MEIIKDYVRHRPNSVRNHIRKYFNLSAPVELKLKKSGGGVIILNSLTIASPDWDGLYFREIPVTLEAVSEAGYRFIGWKGTAIDSKHPLLTINLAADTEIEAVFSKEAGDEN